MRRQVLHLIQREDAEHDAGGCDEQAEHQEVVTGHAEHFDRVERRQLQGRFATVMRLAAAGLRVGEGERGEEQSSEREEEGRGD